MNVEFLEVPVVGVFSCFEVLLSLAEDAVPDDFFFDGSGHFPADDLAAFFNPAVIEVGVGHAH